MSALTFDTLSAELTQALSAKKETPPRTVARCTLSREKVMVLVEYPLDSASAETQAAQTLDWLEEHLREQFDTTGLPEEMADVSEDDDEISVQLYLKHLSESKPFRMRSFTWKVDDGFSELFGEPDEITFLPVDTGAIDASAIPNSLDRDHSFVEESAAVESSPVESDTSEAPDTDSADSFLLAEPESLVLLPEGEEDLILSELEEDHLTLDLEGELDDGELDGTGLDDDLSEGLESGIAGGVPNFSDSSADLDAALSEGVNFNPAIAAPSTEFSLPDGEVIEISSSEFDLPTVDLPDATTSATEASSSDFFTFDADAETTIETDSSENQSSEELDFSSVFVSADEGSVVESNVNNDLFDISSTESLTEESGLTESLFDTDDDSVTESDSKGLEDEEIEDSEAELVSLIEARFEIEEAEPEVAELEVTEPEEAELEIAEPEEAGPEVAEPEEAELEEAAIEKAKLEVSEPEETELGITEPEEAELEVAEPEETELEEAAIESPLESEIAEPSVIEASAENEASSERFLSEELLSEELLSEELLTDEYSSETDPVDTEQLGDEGTEGLTNLSPLLLTDELTYEANSLEALGDTTLEDAEIDDSLMEEVNLSPLLTDESPTPEESETTSDISAETLIPSDIPESTEADVNLPSIDSFSLENDSFDEAAAADPVVDGFIEDIDPALSSSASDTAEIDLSDALDLSALAAGYGLSNLDDGDSEDEYLQDKVFPNGAFPDGAFENDPAHDKLTLEDEATADDSPTETEDLSDYYVDDESDATGEEDSIEYEYESEDYDSEEYRDDPNYYLDGEQAYEEPYEEDDVALIDEGEVQRQREQWQQQSRSNPWLLFGSLGFVVIAALGYIVSRPCVFTQCSRIQDAQVRGDEAIGNLRADASLDDVRDSQVELQRAIRMLEPIPVWSRYHDQVQGILPEYEYQIEALDLITVAQGKAYSAAVKSQDPPHPVSTWSNIADEWREAIAALADVPADSPVRDLADSKLVEYRANLSTIVLRTETESNAELSLRQATQAAGQATQATKSAQSLADWENALTLWETTMSELRQIPQGTKAYPDAQKLLPDYDKDYQAVRERTEKERSADRSLSKAKEFAADAQRAKTDAEWTLSLERWNSAIYQLNDVPEGSLAHSEVEALLTRYTAELEKAQQSQQVALNFQPVEPSFYFICGVGSLQRCTYTVQSDSIRVDIFEGYDAVIGQSITPPNQRGSVTPDPNFVDQGNELLQQITLLSTQAQLPVELYNAKGQFMARYKPELDGFVKEQG